MSSISKRSSRRQTWIERIDNVADNWRTIQLETSPIDKAEASEAISRLYQHVWGVPPKQVLFFESPMACALALLGMPNEVPKSAADKAECWRRSRKGLTSRIYFHDSSERDLPYEMKRVYVDCWDDQGLPTKDWLDLDRYLDISCYNSRWPGYTVFEKGEQKTPDQFEWFQPIKKQLYEQLSSEIISAYFRIEIEDPQRWTRAIFDSKLVRDHDFSSQVNNFINLYLGARDLEFIFLNRSLEDFHNLFEVARTCGYGSWVKGDFACVAQRPKSITLDERQRLHNADGPAMVWRDGYEVYAWKGIPVPEWAIKDKSNITAKGIFATQNAEVRRALIDIMGYENFITEGRAAKVSTDETGTLWRCRFDQRVGITWFHTLQVVDTWQVVELKNGTPEADGHHKTCFIEVPPDMRSARQAVAWTFGLSEEEYYPDIET